MTGDKKTGEKNTSGRGQRELRVRVKTAKGRKLSSTLWLERQLNDPYVVRAKKEGYRGRAAYKILELDDKYGFLKPGARVVDLGCAQCLYLRRGQRRYRRCAQRRYATGLYCANLRRGQRRNACCRQRRYLGALKDCYVCRLYDRHLRCGQRFDLHGIHGIDGCG
jgi:hypothetical protein